MFKPHLNTCSYCGNNCMVVVKKLLCMKCNERIKKEKKALRAFPPKTFTPKTQEKKQKIFDELKLKYQTKKLKQKPLKRTAIKKKFPKSKGKIDLFHEIYEECGGICRITGEWFPFDINSCMHILSHGAYGQFEMEKKNIWFVNPRIHHLYDNSSQEKLLAEFPRAIIIYEEKEKLKIEHKER